MACGFTGFQLQTDVGRLCASWRLSDDERPKARNKFSGGKNGGTSTLTTAASPSTKTRTLATSIVTLPHPQTAANTNRAKEDAVSQLLLNTTVPSSPFFFADQTKQGQARNLYMGYETWLPVASKVNKPRTLYNAEALAYLGDSIYELYARRHFLFPPLSIDEYNSRVMAVVRCESQVNGLYQMTDLKVLYANGLIMSDVKLFGMRILALVLNGPLPLLIVVESL